MQLHAAVLIALGTCVFLAGCSSYVWQDSNGHFHNGIGFAGSGPTAHQAAEQQQYFAKQKAERDAATQKARAEWAKWAKEHPAEAKARTSAETNYLHFDQLAYAGSRTQIMDAQACDKIASSAFDLYSQVRSMMEGLRIPFDTALSQATFDPTEISEEDFDTVASWTRPAIKLD